MTWYEAIWGLIGGVLLVAIFGYMLVAANGCGSTRNVAEPVNIEAHMHRGFDLYSSDGQFDVHYSIAGPGWIGVHGANGVWEFWPADGTGTIHDAAGVAGMNNLQVIADEDMVTVYWLRLGD